MILARRAFLTGLIAAPIIVREGLIMPVRTGLIDAHDLAEVKGRTLFAIYGRNERGETIFEMISPGEIGKKMFRHIDRMEFVDSNANAKVTFGLTT